MFRKLVGVGQAFNALRGIVWAVIAVPIALTWIAGYLEGLSWSGIFAYGMIALASGGVLGYYVLLMSERLLAYSTTKATKNRIEKQIREYLGDEIDTPTAAGIWAGTLEASDLQRHLYFRMIKSAIDSGEIKNPKFNGESKKANMHTKIGLGEFLNYLKARGVV